MKPVVLVTADRREGSGPEPGPRVRPRGSESFVTEDYLEAVRAVGGLPIVLPAGETDLEALLDRVDAVLLTGGHFDIHPSHYGQDPSARLDRTDEGRTQAELALARVCLQADLPVLGICGGMQALAVASGGTLIQDLPKPDPDHPERIDHEQRADPAVPSHDVQVVAPADRWLGSRVRVNSTHHQAVDRPGAGMVACGHAPDGVIEVICAPALRFALGVQWHPERLGQLEAYRGLVDTARTCS